MKNKLILEEASDIARAVEMVELGARMQMLEAETQLSRERLLKIYKEVRGVSPPKGMLPFSTDWFMTWQPNVHASLFMNLHGFYRDRPAVDGLDAILKAFHLYLDHVESCRIEPVLSLTRAWTLVRFFDAELLQLTVCTRCQASYVTHAYEPAAEYVCGLCNIPSRAGKSVKVPKTRARKSPRTARSAAKVTV